jgi:hypothetical protein
MLKLLNAYMNLLVSLPHQNRNLHLIVNVGNKTGNYNKTGTTAQVAFLIKITNKNRFFSCNVIWIAV